VKHDPSYRSGTVGGGALKQGVIFEITSNIEGVDEMIILTTMGVHSVDILDFCIYVRNKRENMCKYYLEIFMELFRINFVIYNDSIEICLNSEKEVLP